ncbi:MAG: SRPBCC family protein [Anaerolineae bacterium]|jgi:uncharacterized protein YndB with AHSA1/START domain
MPEQGLPLVYQDLIVTRVFDAPVEELWKAWTVPERLMAWWGPATFTTPKAEMDVREGGKLLWCMQEPTDQGGRLTCNAGEFTKVIPNKLLQFNIWFADEQGNRISASQLGMDMPDEFEAEVQFESLGGKTVLTYIERNWPLTQYFAFTYAGVYQSFDKLEQALKGAGVTTSRG